MPSFDSAVLPRTPMSRDGLDRRTEDRVDDALLAEALAAESTRFIVQAGEGLQPASTLTRTPRADGQADPRPALLTRGEAQPFLEGARATVALGVTREDASVHVVALLAEQGRGAGDLVAQPTRAVMHAALEAEDIPYLSAVTQAQAVLAWHAAHGYSPETGRPTVQTASGWIRRDPVTGTEFFPRTDPAVIVALVDEQDRLILGHNAAWPANRYSTFAGFVEPGEAPEAAVVREMREEAGVEVDAVRYLGSQPWPFPRSLMLGYIARTASAPVADAEEITEVRTFTREELDRAVESGEVELPGELSISRSLIEAWKSAADTAEGAL